MQNKSLWNFTIWTLALTALPAAQAVAQESFTTSFCRTEFSVSTIGPEFTSLLYSPSNGYVQSSARVFYIGRASFTPASNIDPLVYRAVSVLISGGGNVRSVVETAGLIDVLRDTPELAIEMLSEAFARRQVNGVYSFFNPELQSEMINELLRLSSLRTEIANILSSIDSAEEQLRDSIAISREIADLGVKQRILELAKEIPSLLFSQFNLLQERAPQGQNRSDAYATMLTWIESVGNIPDGVLDRGKLSATDIASEGIRMANSAHRLELAMISVEENQVERELRLLRSSLEARNLQLEQMSLSFASDLVTALAASVPCQDCIVQLVDVGGNATFVPLGNILGRISDTPSTWVADAESGQFNPQDVILLPSSFPFQSVELRVDPLGSRIWVDERFFQSSWFLDLNGPVTSADTPGTRWRTSLTSFSMVGPQLDLMRDQDRIVQDEFFFPDPFEFLVAQVGRENVELAVYEAVEQDTCPN